MNPKSFVLRPILGGFIFGIFLGILFWSIVGSFVVGSLFWLCVGVTFGLLMSTYNFVAMRRLVRTYGNYEWMKTHHERKITLPIEFERAFDLCLDVVKNLRRCRIQGQNRYAGRIEAIRFPKIPNWRYVDLITIELRNVENGTSIRVSSRPLFHRATDVDFGSNLKNVEEIVSKLKESYRMYSAHSSNFFG